MLAAGNNLEYIDLALNLRLGAADSKTIAGWNSSASAWHLPAATIHSDMRFNIIYIMRISLSGDLPRRVGNDCNWRGRWLSRG